MRLIQCPRKDQRGICHAGRTYNTDVDDWFAGGGILAETSLWLSNAVTLILNKVKTYGEALGRDY